MGCLGNIIWILFGGLMTAIEYFLSGFLMMCTIIGIPFGLQSFKLGMLCLWPFGSEVIKKPTSGCLNTFMNILWLILGGLIICITHLFWSALLCISIIGIPFGLQHFKMAGLALAPFGRQIIDK